MNFFVFLYNYTVDVVVVVFFFFKEISEQMPTPELVAVH